MAGALGPPTSPGTAWPGQAYSAPQPPVIGTHCPAPHDPPSQGDPSGVGVSPMQTEPAQKSALVHGLPSSHGVTAPEMCVHPVPTVHESRVQTLPSLHCEESGKCWQPRNLSQKSDVQAIPSSQFTGAIWHAPAAQSSIPLQALPSEHVVPSGATVWEHPVTVLHESIVQGLWSSQSMGCPWQTAPKHMSPPVHAVPSLQNYGPAEKCVHPVPTVHESRVQELPSLHCEESGMCWQPSTLSQKSDVHGMESSQFTGATWQTPAAQSSIPLHALPSEHVVPSGDAILEQPVAALHESVVQGLWSSQLTGVPWQTEPKHMSPVVHALPSLHGIGPAGMWEQPVVTLHESSVHTLLSLHAAWFSV